MHMQTSQPLGDRKFGRATIITLKEPYFCSLTKTHHISTILEVYLTSAVIEEAMFQTSPTTTQTVWARSGDISMKGFTGSMRIY